MPRMKPHLLATFLEQPFAVVIATLQRDGRPYTVPVWWPHEDGASWITDTYSHAST